MTIVPCRQCDWCGAREPMRSGDDMPNGWTALILPAFPGVALDLIDRTTATASLDTCPACRVPVEQGLAAALSAVRMGRGRPAFVAPGFEVAAVEQ